MDKCKYCNKALRKGSAPDFHKVCYPKWQYAAFTSKAVKALKALKDPYGLYLPPALRK